MPGLALTIFFVSTSPPSATAAEGQKEAAQMNEAYRGWVHLKTNVKGPDIPHAPKESTEHSNTADGTHITDRTFLNGRRQVRLQRPSNREEVLYDSESKQIRIGTLSEDIAKDWQQETRSSPYTISGFLEAMMRSRQGEAVVTTETRDGDLDRFDIAIPKQERSRESAPLLADISVWTDRKTKLVRRASVTVDGTPVEVNFTYGPPEIRDVYDLGVPRDAQVVDNRMTPDADAVFSRLEKRFAKGYGPHVALLSEYRVDADGIPAKIGGLKLMAESGNGDVLSNRYAIRTADIASTCGVRIDLEGWPVPPLAATLNSLKDISPWDFLVILQGNSGWQGFLMKPDEYHLNTLKGKYTQIIPSLLAQFSLPGIVWRTRSGLGLSGADAKVVIEPARDHPGWIGLKIEQTIRTGKGQAGGPANTERHESLYVIDPTRDDMPISFTYAPTPAKRVEIVYNEYAQLPGGAWYPVSWTTTTISRMPGSKDIRKEEMARLQIFPSAKLDDRWFRNYGDKSEPAAT